MNMSNKAEMLMYQPLHHQDSFRLLKLERSSSEDSWNGTLVEHRLSSDSFETDTPKYLALSYVWGEATYNVPSEDSIEASFSMSTGLAQILRDAVGPEILHIWIDRFCVNQRDKNEKSHQVSIMWRIFAEAEKVVGWLGPAFEECDEAFDDLIMFATPVPGDNTSEDQFLSIIKSRFGDAISLDAVMSYISRVMLLGSDLRNRMVRLFNLPWFGRRWIAQEACLASNLRIRCGHRSVSGKQLFQAIHNIHSVVVEGAFSWLQKPFRNALNLLQTRQMVREAAMASSHLSFPHIVQKLSFLDCGCDKDRVNALFGIVGKSASWFSPRYDLPATRLFVEFAIEHMRHLRSFEILHFAGITDPTRHHIRYREGIATFEIARPAEDLPSWVPDWRVRYRPLPLISAEHEALKHGRALLPFHLPSDGSHKTLTLTCKLLKTPIQPCGVPHLDLFNPEETWQNQKSVDPWCNQMFVNYLTELDPSLGTLYRHSPSFTHWLESAIHAGRDPTSLDGLILRFARTLVMDRRVRSTEKQDLMVPQGKILEYFREYAKLALVADTHAASAAYTAMADDTACMEKVAAYGYQAEHICRYRTLFLGEGGLMGLGAVGISPGDRICFLSGLSTPFILHPKGDRFGLRGECYLDGHMDIAFEDLEAEETIIVLE